MFQTDMAEKIKHTIYVQKLFFFKNGGVYAIIWENMVEPDRPQTKI
jgi:hypothetical protein